jgi:hypothetical protein
MKRNPGHLAVPLNPSEGGTHDIQAGDHTRSYANFGAHPFSPPLSIRTRVPESLPREFDIFLTRVSGTMTCFTTQNTRETKQSYSSSFLGLAHLPIVPGLSTLSAFVKYYTPHTRARFPLYPDRVCMEQVHLSLSCHVVIQTALSGVTDVCNTYVGARACSVKPVQACIVGYTRIRMLMRKWFMQYT